jgi:hypothetical protein
VRILDFHLKNRGGFWTSLLGFEDEMFWFARIWALCAAGQHTEEPFWKSLHFLLH